MIDLPSGTDINFRSDTVASPRSDSSIDLRSDTVTRPTPEMLAAMLGARVGDDVFGDDETVNALQQKAADLFGMEAALFCPSGTMTNQIGIKLHTQPADEVICHQVAHIYLSEGGGIAFNSGASVRPLTGEQGRFTAEQVRAAINPREDVHYANTRVVAVENTVMRGGGSCWDLAEIRRIRQVCVEHGLAFHLDGARLFNALVARQESPQDYGSLFDTISICLSKGLGAPVGSLLLGRKEHVKKARRIRKALGGAMRQSGYLAAAGIYALDHHVDRLKDDHTKAKRLERELPNLRGIATVVPVETNIVIFQLTAAVGAENFLAYLQQHGVRAMKLDPQTIRMVFHLDVSDGQFERLLAALRAFSP